MASTMNVTGLPATTPFKSGGWLVILGGSTIFLKNVKVTHAFRSSIIS